MFPLKLKNLFLLILFISFDAEATYLYYTNLSPNFNDGWIRQMSADGTVAGNVRQVGDGLRGLAVDESFNSLYWSDVNSDRIERVNLNDLEGVSSGVVTTGLSFPQDIKLSSATAQLFWTDPTLGRVERINTDGSDRSVLFSAHSVAIAIDDVNGKIYSENRSDVARGSIIRSNYDGSGFETVIDNVPTASDLAVDPIHEFIYWTSSAGLSNGNGGVYRVGFDGSNFSELFVMGSNLDTSGIALDLSEGLLYWGQETSTNIDSIYKMNLDGTGVGVVGPTGSSITEIVIGQSLVAVPIPASLWLFGSGLLVLIGRTRKKMTYQPPN